jgi:hypothetical protein
MARRETSDRGAQARLDAAFLALQGGDDCADCRWLNAWGVLGMKAYEVTGIAVKLIEAAEAYLTRGEGRLSPQGRLEIFRRFMSAAEDDHQPGDSAYLRTSDGALFWRRVCPEGAHPLPTGARKRTQVAASSGVILTDSAVARVLDAAQIVTALEGSHAARLEAGAELARRFSGRLDGLDLAVTPALIATRMRDAMNAASPGSGCRQIEAIERRLMGERPEA